MASGLDNTPDYLLELSTDPVRFEPASKLTNVFFDEANCQVFVVRSGGATGVVVKGPDDKALLHFRMVDKGEVFSIKFSPDKKILSIQRGHKSVEFINFNGELDTIEYSQSCKGKTTKVLGFTWTSINEVVFITDHGIEHYQVIPEKRSLKSLKTYNLSVNWHVYHPGSALLLLSSGTMGNVMHPFQFRPGAAYKLSKFEIDLPIAPKAQKISLLQRDVSIATVYGKTCIFVLRHQPRSVGTAGAEVVIYSLQKDGPPRKTNILKLDMSGRFAISVIDNLIIVHHQASKKSMIYDIRMPGETDGFVTYHSPVVSPYPIKPFLLKVPAVPSPNSSEPAGISCELYSPNWVVFQPNIVIDAKLGCLWYVNMHLYPLVDMIQDKCKLIDFLLLRKNSKAVILKVCREAIIHGNQLFLHVIGEIFDKLNHACHPCTENEKLNCGTRYSSVAQTSVVDQSDMYTNVFTLFEDDKFTNCKFTVAVLLEYIRSLTQHQQYVQHYLCKLLINVLVQYKKFYQLHQFLQYHILSDSKPLACLMLSLQNVYPPAHQLALDMLKRLQNANEEIIEVLLSQRQILPALRFVRSCGNIDSLSAPKYLAAAKNTGDASTFYAVFKFFEQRNIRLRGSPNFEPGEHCDLYVKHFESLFGSTSIDSNQNPNKIC